jgi:hypothetical protein
MSYDLLSITIKGTAMAPTTIGVASPRKRGGDGSDDENNEELIFSEENEAVMVALRQSVTAGMAEKIREMYAINPSRPSIPAATTPATSNTVLMTNSAPVNKSLEKTVASESDEPEDFLAKRV